MRDPAVELTSKDFAREFPASSPPPGALPASNTNSTRKLWGNTLLFLSLLILSSSSFVRERLRPSTNPVLNQKYIIKDDPEIFLQKNSNLTSPWQVRPCSGREMRPSSKTHSSSFVSSSVVGESPLSIASSLNCSCCFFSAPPGVTWSRLRSILLLRLDGTRCCLPDACFLLCEKTHDFAMNTLNLMSWKCLGGLWKRILEACRVRACGRVPFTNRP
mmetsp:Transcript_8259/g.20821  ORF Transcript_8259/g.20821 Transcript_8259/m.20821 type:complete len:217 (+) Transcript_8259:227-877(+)